MSSKDTELKVAEALAVLERLASEICAHRGGFRMEVRMGNTNVHIQFCAENRSDSGRLVGKAAVHLAALHTLARLMLKPLGKVVDIDKVKSATNAEDPYEPFTPVVLWPRRKLSELLEDTAKACFPETVLWVRVRDTERNNHGTEMRVVLPDIGGRDERDFGEAVAVLFKVIGVNNGRRVYADIEGAGGGKRTDNQTSPVQS